MPRNSSGVYSLPSGTLAETQTTISSTKFNAFAQDLESQLNTVRENSVVGYGQAIYTTKTAAQSANIDATIKTVKTNGYYNDNDGGGAEYKRVDAEPSSAEKFRSLDRYLSDGTEDTSNGGWWVLSSVIKNIKMFGAVGDGTTDDATALQNALDANQIIFVPPGKYRTTATLLVDPARNRGSGLFGIVAPSIFTATGQTGGPTWDGSQEAHIFYDGSAGVTTAVLAVSSEAVGTEPASTFDTTVWNFLLENIVLNGNDKAQYGLYGARLQDAHVVNVYARQCEGDGFYLNGIYSGYYHNISARNNGGRGISIGAAGHDLGWTVNNLCNGVTFGDLWAYNNGLDLTFDHTTNIRGGAGVYFRPHRGCTINRITSELNDGAGIVFEPTSQGNSIRNVYTELNSQTATFQNGIIFIGVTGGVSYGNIVDTGFLASEELRITGTEPSTGRPESAPEFRNLSGGSGTTAGWSNYRLVDCGQEFTGSNISGSAPTGGSHMPAGITFDRTKSTLADYEEGSFTPTVVGSTTPGTQGYSVQVGRYTRIGNMVYGSGYVVLNATSGAAGALRIGGLPFTSANISNFFQSANIPYWLNLTTSAVSGGSIAANTDYIELHSDAAASVGTTINATEITATTRFRFNFHYQVA